jgi:YegS/Rv2252/BmrU family lipid kinase
MQSLKNIHIILNPAAGIKNPPLRVFNQHFKKAGYDWDVSITKDRGDGTRLTEKAIQDGADIVVAYGGDGTVMEVASGLQNTDSPMAILPGGTGNILSAELGIPQNLEQACELITKPEQFRIHKIDVGCSDDPDLPAFTLRAGVGLEANMLEGTDRELKENYGIFAYIMGAIQALGGAKEALYHLVLDDKELECEGLTCLIANAGYFGVPGITLDPKVKIDDGLLDVFVIRQMDLLGLFSLAASVARGSEKKAPTHHWQAKSIRIESDPPQPTQADGEMWGKSPVNICINPQSLNVIVPK